MPSDMREIILNSSEQIRHSLDVNKDVRVEGEFDSIILAAMGGSWHPAAILRSLNVATVPIWIHSDYDLPHIPVQNPLVITSSYSGNTEEALSAYEAAKKAGYKLLVNTSGGTLEEWSKRDNVPVAKIDYPGMQPRHTTFASFAGVAAALMNSGLAQDIREELGKVTDWLKGITPTLEAPAKELAASLNGTIPVYTASTALFYAAQNFKIQTNENAKYPAFWNTFPELNHNEMVGLSRNNDLKFPLYAVLIRDNNDHPRNKARMDVTKDLYTSWGIKVSEVTLQGTTMLEKISYAIVFGLWTTYHLAVMNNVDPVPVEGVENFKTKLKEVAG